MDRASGIRRPGCQCADHLRPPTFPQKERESLAGREGLGESQHVNRSTFFPCCEPDVLCVDRDDLDSACPYVDVDEPADRTQVVLLPTEQRNPIDHAAGAEPFNMKTRVEPVGKSVSFRNLQPVLAT